MKKHKLLVSLVFVSFLLMNLCASNCFAKPLCPCCEEKSDTCCRLTSANDEVLGATAIDVSFVPVISFPIIEIAITANFFELQELTSHFPRSPSVLCKILNPSNAPPYSS